MNGDAETVERIREAQWRQGSVVSSESVPHLASVALGPSIAEASAIDWWIVLTHDCDILNPDLRKEPWVEVIVVHPVGPSEASPELRHGRNPRRIQFEGCVGDRRAPLEASVHDRWRIPREEFARLRLDPRRTIAGDILRLLTQWVAKRYVRSGFPDAFNDRLRPAQSVLRKFLRTHDAHLEAVYVFLDPAGEIPEGAAYRCAMVFVHPAEWNDPDGRETIATELREILGECQGIELAGVSARSDEEFTLADMKRMRRMDFDFLSYEDDDPLLPPAGIDVE